MKLGTRLQILLGLHIAVGGSSAMMATLALFAGRYEISGLFVVVIILNMFAFHLWAKKYKGRESLEEEA